MNKWETIGRMKMNIEDKKNHLTDKQIWLLRMLFEELGNKNLNEALRQWEEHAKISGPTKDTSINNRRGTKDEELISRLETTRENAVIQIVKAERGATERAPEPLPSRIKRKSRGHE